MDMTSLSGDSSPAVEYTAQAASPMISGEAKLTIGANALAVTTLFDSLMISFAEINALIFADYSVTVAADCGNFTFSRMGHWCGPFYDALYMAYNKAVLRSLFIKGDPIVKAGGEFRYSETGFSAPSQTAHPVLRNQANAVAIHVYDNNITALPPDLTARRVPLCFVSGMDKAAYNLTLRLDSGDSYSYARLGYETDPVCDAIETQIRKLRDESLAAVREIDPDLSTVQSSQLARLTVRGIAAPFGRLAGVAPSFVSALEGKIAGTRAASSYATFKQLCDPANIWIGFKKNDSGLYPGGDGGEGGGERGGEGSGGDGLLSLTASMPSVRDADYSEPVGDDNAEPDPYLLWMIAPSPDGRFTAVEFCVDNSATFVYRTGGDFTAFAHRLNRALEAIDFRREVIRLTDEQLRKPENADYFMAAKRTAALQFVRANYVSRIIHSGVDAWKRKLTEAWGV